LIGKDFVVIIIVITKFHIIIVVPFNTAIITIVIIIVVIEMITLLIICDANTSSHSAGILHEYSTVSLRLCKQHRRQQQVSSLYTNCMCVDDGEEHYQ